MMGSVSGRGESLAAVRSTLRESFVASDIAESHRMLTLAAVLDDERKSATTDNAVVRTLFDIIRTEETPSSGSTSKRTSWKLLRERLKRRGNNASNPSPGDGLRSVRRASSFGAEAAPTMTGGGGGWMQRSSSMRLSAALAAEREMMMSVPSVGTGPAQEEPVRMSLMEMLEDQAGVQEIEDRLDEEDEGDGYEEVAVTELEPEEERGGGLVVEMICCVCMVRHKGAAFIPCGHTFCRMCSRELWVKRGHCPLCNNSILEILDIF